MKGLSSIIAVVLILLITVSLSALAYLFFGNVFAELTQTGSNESEKIITTLTSSMLIDSATENQIFIRNTGQSDLTKFFITLNGIPINFTIDKPVLPNGEIAT